MWHIMTIGDLSAIGMQVCLTYLDLEKRLVLLLLGTIIQCSFVNCFAGSNLSIFKLKIESAWFPFCTLFNPVCLWIFFLWSYYGVLWYWPLIVSRYLRCIKKARSWHIFFSIHNSIVYCYVPLDQFSVIFWQSWSQRSLSWTIALS